MPHSWDAYYKAQKVAKRLYEAGMIKSHNLEMVRGIIQTILEDS